MLIRDNTKKFKPKLVNHCKAMIKQSHPQSVPRTIACLIKVPEQLVRLSAYSANAFRSVLMNITKPVALY